MLRSGFALCLLLNLVAIDAFLFPDLKIRSGRAGNTANLRITVLQEEPYLFSNGSGYLPDLMRRIAESYSVLHEGSSFSYEIAPVRSWAELLSGATRPNGGVSFGLVVPSLELSDWNSKHLRTSVPTVYSSVKVVSKKGRDGESGLQSRTGRQRHVIVLRGSPLEYLLVRANHHIGTVQTVESTDEAMARVRSDDDWALLTTSGVADRLAALSPEDLMSYCTKKTPGSSPIFYAFFGSDSRQIDKLNEVIVHLMSRDKLLSLYSKYFSSTHQCLL